MELLLGTAILGVRRAFFFFIDGDVIVEKGIASDGIGNRIANENLAFADFVGTKSKIVLGAINAVFFINNFNGAFVV